MLSKVVMLINSITLRLYIQCIKKTQSGYKAIC